MTAHKANHQIDDHLKVTTPQAFPEVLAGYIALVNRDGVIESAGRCEGHLTAEKLVGRSIFDCIPAEARSPFSRKFEQVLTTSSVETLRLPPPAHCDQGGSIEIKLVPLPELGRPVQTIAVAFRRTVSGTIKEKVDAKEPRVVSKPLAASGELPCERNLRDRQQLETRLQQSEANFQHLADSSLQGILLVQGQSVIFANRQSAVLAGTSVSQLEALSLDMVFEKLVHPQSLDQVRRSYADFRQGLAPDFHLEVRTAAPKIDTKWIEITAMPVKHGTDTCTQVSLIDITTRRRMEEALKQSEANYRLLVEHQTDLIVKIDAEGKLLFASPSYCEMFGLKVEDILGKRFVHLANGEGRREMKEVLEKLHHSPHRTFFEQYTQTKDGKRWLAWSHSAILGEKDGLLSIVGVGRDITEHKEDVELLRQSQEAFRDLVENVDDILYTLDRDFCVTYVSPVVKKVLGYHPSELLGENALSLVHSEDLPGLQSAVEDAMNNRLYPSEYRMRTKSGGFRWVRTLSRPILENGDFAGIRGVLADITERKLAEEALQESEARFEKVTQQSREMVWEVNSEGLFTYVSQVCEAILGYLPEEMIGKMHFYDLQPKAEREAFKQAAFGQIARGESFHNQINRAQTKSGSSVWFLTSGSPVLDEMGNVKGYIGADLDITERMQMEEELREANELLTSERHALDERNIALRVLLNQIQDEVNQVKQNVQTNITEFAIPALERIKSSSRQSDWINIDLLESALENIASPFVQNIKSSLGQLTPREVEICGMIREGLRSREIGLALNISVRTVDKFRQKIRQKLGVDNSDTNLTTYLRSVTDK